MNINNNHRFESVLRNYVQETMLFHARSADIGSRSLVRSANPAFYEIRPHVFERNYVTNVLGIDLPLNESYPYSGPVYNQIIKEQLLLEGFFSDILQKGKDVLMSTVEGVKQFGKEAWSVLKGFYLAVREGKTESLFRAIAQDVIKNIYMPLRKALQYLAEKLPGWKMPKIGDLAQKGLDMLKGLKDKMMSAKGWQKIAMASGVAIGLQWLWEKIGDFIEDLGAATDGWTLAEAGGSIDQVKQLVKNAAPDALQGIIGSKFKDIVEKIATAASVGPWWEAAKSVGKGAAIVTAASGGATKKFVDDHEQQERVKKGTTTKEEQNESLLRQIVREALAHEYAKDFLTEAAIGQCYPHAIKLAQQSTDEEFFDLSKFKVVHGRITDKWSGESVDHAWVEKGGMVFDWQTHGANPDGIPHDVYYDTFQPETYNEYTAEETLINCVKTGQKGPWA